MTMPMKLESSSNYEIVDLSQFKSKKDHDRVVAWVMQEHGKAKNARTKIERQWYLNLAFYFGQQYVQFVNTSTDAGGRGFSLSVPRAPRWRVRLVSNKIRPIVRTELAKLTSQKPTAFVIPASSDDQDINAARAGELIWESMYGRKRLRQTLRKSLFWTSICGTGYVKTYWDDAAIDPSSDQTGDICYEAENPFAIFVPDLMEEEIEGQPFVIHASAKDPEWVSLRYAKGLDGKQLKPDVKSTNEILDSGFLNLVGATNNQKNSVLTLEAWIKPGMTKMFPNGAVVTIVGGTIVQLVEGGYPHREFPFAKIDHIPSGKYYADSVVTDLVPLQKEYNRTRSQIIEAKNLMGKPQLMAPRGSIDPRKISSEPGQVILYTPGFQPPSPLPLQGIPGFVLQELDRIESDMEDISGQHEVTKGNAPPGVTAATAISFLQEQDDSKLSHTVESIESAVEKIARQTLSLVGTYWDTQRVVKVAGKEHMFDAEVLKGSDLNGNTDIRVEAGSALPQSKAAKQAFIMDLMKMGFVDPSQGLAVLDMSGIDKLYEGIEIDQRQAQRENVRMQAGQPVAVNTWDNHQVHILMHDKFRKSQVFESFDDNVKALFEQHVQMHKTVMQTGMLPPELGGDPTMAGVGGGMMPPDAGGQNPNAALGGPPDAGNPNQMQLPMGGM